MSQSKAGRLCRSEVPEELTWNLKDVFINDEAWEKEINTIKRDVTSVTQYQGKLADGVDTLIACLKAYEALVERISKVRAYAHLLLSGDGIDPNNQEKAAQISTMQADLQAQFYFLESELLSLPDEKVEAYLLHPKINDYTKMIRDILETKPHRLEPETEKVLAALGEIHDAPYMIYQRTKAADMQFDSIQDEDSNELAMSFALYEEKYQSSPNTEIRRGAAQSFGCTLAKYQNTFAGTYGTEVKKQVVLSKLRNYPSVTHMLLQSQQVTLEMYHNQLDIIQKELAPHMRRYAKLKQKQLNLDKLLFCDLKAPMDPGYIPEISFSEARELIIDALQILGPEYAEIIEEALHNRWVDLADNVGKSTGAFCMPIYGLHPYILVTWTDSLSSTFTLAHELGHAGHFALASKYQRLVNTRPSTYLVEAPSTMNELLVGNHVLAKTKDLRMKRWVILQYLDTYYHNFVTHLLEGEFQRRIYGIAESGRPVTATLLNEQKAQVLADFWGDQVELDEGAKFTWMRQPHYYMGLYPYTYSAGLTIATACAQMIKEEGAPAIERWLKFLKVGGKYKPLEHAKIAGIDMSSAEPIRKAVSFVGSLVDELERGYTCSE